MMKVPYYFFSESGHFGTKKGCFFSSSASTLPRQTWGNHIKFALIRSLFLLKMGWVLLLAPPTPTLWHDGDMICDHFPAQSFEGVKILGEMKGVPSGGRVDLCCLSIGFEQLVILAHLFEMWNCEDRGVSRRGLQRYEAQMLSMQKVAKMTRDSPCSIASSV